MPTVLRHKGARGEIPVSPDEKIEILVILAREPDEGVRHEALQTLLAWNPEQLKLVLRNPETAPEVLDFAVNFLAPARPELTEALAQNPNLLADQRQWLQSLSAELKAQSVITTDDSVAAPPAPETPSTEAKRETLLQRITRMSAVEKIKLALTGNMEERMILIRDSNKVVSRAVLQSPKLSDQEIENYASMKSVTEEVLRLIARNRNFMKNYAVVRALINNPRAPIDITMPLLNRLNERDMKMLALNKNVPDVIRTLAFKTMKAREEARKAKIPGKH